MLIVLAKWRKLLHTIRLFLPPILNEVSLQLAIERVQEVQAFMSVPVAIEPPPMTFMVGTMPLMTFLVVWRRKLTVRFY